MSSYSGREASSSRRSEAKEGRYKQRSRWSRGRGILQPPESILSRNDTAGLEHSMYFVFQRRWPFRFSLNR